MAISSFIHSICSFITFYWRRCVGVLFALLQKMNVRDPQERLEELKDRQGCVLTGTIILRWKSDLNSSSSHEDFLSRSRRELSSLDVLRKQDVSLYCITPTSVVFVRTEENCYRSETSPFFYLAQFWNAEEVYVTSHSWFNRLASEIAEDCLRVPVTWLSNTGRCGSTMLCQVMEGVPGTVCVSEPDAILNITELRRSGLITSHQALPLLRSAIFILIFHAKGQKQFPGSHTITEHIFIKTRSSCTALIEDIHKTCPQIRHVFMYRRLSSYLKSLLKLVARLDLPWLMLANSDRVAAMTPWFRRYVFRQVFSGSERESLRDLVPDLSYAGLLTTMICSQLKLVQSLQAEGFPIPALLYEDVVADPASTVGRLLDYLHLPRDGLHTALRSLSTMSQSAVPGFEDPKGSPGYHLTDREWEDVDRVLARFQLPKRDEDVQFSQRLGLDH